MKKILFGMMAVALLSTSAYAAGGKKDKAKKAKAQSEACQEECTKACEKTCATMHCCSGAN